MNRLAIFVEGYTEVVFVERLIEEIAGRDKVLIEHREIRGGATVRRTFAQVRAARPDTGQQYYVLIVDCGGDRQVKSRIVEEHEGLFASVAGCGQIVDLGGSSPGGADAASDTSAADTAPPPMVVDLCEPCSSPTGCPASTTCAQISGPHLFCATPCPIGTECDPDDTCQLVTSSVPGQPVRACVPKSGQCALPPPPTSDGAVVIDHCGVLDGPSVSAMCRSCEQTDRDCQKNACYGGWWCNTKTERCQKPPTFCP